ncbi:MAG: hypothetical protein WCW16_02030 [Candidatus Magasanikbacteria bacterium]
MNLLYKLTKYRTVLTILAIAVFGLVLSPSFVGAASGDDPFGIDVIQDGDADSTGIALGKADLRVTATKIINIALSMLGIIAVVIVLIGGFKWMTAGGNEEKVGEARKWIFSGIIGMAVILAAWAIARFALIQLGRATGTTSDTTYTL